MSDEHLGVAFVRTLYQCRELGAALARFASADTLQNVKSSLEAGVASRYASEDTVPSDATLVAMLVVKDLERTEHQFSCQPTEQGLEVVRLLQRAAFGEASLGRSFAESAYLATLAQARQALELVTAALLDLVATHNCLSLFNVAAACGCAPLRRKAYALAKRQFAVACQRDGVGLACMEEEHLLRLLCSDNLQVSSELDVFRALAAWTQHAPEERRPRFAARLARCLRLGALTLADLYLLDSHPLVAGDRQAIMLVAQVYMHLAMGVALDCPLGFRTASCPRTCQLSADVSASAQQEQQPAAAHSMCGLAEHAGRHSSVFEAVVCAFSRAVQQPAQQQAEAGNEAEAGMRRLSLAGTSPTAPAAASKAPDSTVKLAPSSPVALAEAPTPSAAAAGAAAAPAALQQQSRVRQPAAAKRVASRRTLFDAAADGDSKPAGAGATAQHAAAVPSAGASCTSSGDRLVGSVGVEMRMSPHRASMSAIMQAAAAAAAAGATEPFPGAWQSRKRLRFD